VKKAILAMVLTIVILTIQWDSREQELMGQINALQAQVQQLNTELTAIKHQQILNNAVTEDLSNRVRWR
jgi:prefoldin subunit 5